MLQRRLRCWHRLRFVESLLLLLAPRVQRSLLEGIPEPWLERTSRFHQDPPPRSPSARAIEFSCDDSLVRHRAIDPSLGQSLLGSLVLHGGRPTNRRVGIRVHSACERLERTVTLWNPRCRPLRWGLPVAMVRVRGGSKSTRSGQRQGDNGGAIRFGLSGLAVGLQVGIGIKG